jgi:hypothetical protein
MESTAKELCNNLLESFKVDGLVGKLGHVLEGIFCAFEFNQ